MSKKTGFVRPLSARKRFTAGDLSVLREILHPGKGEEKVSYSLAHATIRPGFTTLKHRMKTTEVYHIISGRGVMSINSVKRPVKPGDTVYIPPMAVQCIRNTSRTKPLVFICMVNPPWRQEDEEILASAFV